MGKSRRRSKKGAVDEPMTVAQPSGGDGGGARGGEGESWRNETLDLDNPRQNIENLRKLRTSRS